MQDGGLPKLFKRSGAKFELAMCLFAKQTYGTALKLFNFANQKEINLPLIYQFEPTVYRGGGLQAKLKHCALLVLAMLLVAGTLVLSGPDEGAIRNDLQAPPRQSDQAGSQPGQVMVLRLLPTAGQNGQGQSEALASLARLGVEQGELLDRDSLLVRVPDDKLAAAQKVAGSALQAYTPSARLAPSLVAGAGCPLGSGAAIPEPRRLDGQRHRLPAW